jgi:hypothetical protein
MTERTSSVPVPQAEVPAPDAEKPAGLSADPIPEAAVQAAEQAAAEAEEKARTEAASTLKALVKAYRAGERSYRAGLLEAGRLADQYLHQRMDLGDKRAAAVQAVEGQLAAHASSTVDVNRLVGRFHAYRLLCEEPGLSKVDVPYGHYRDAWCLLVERQSKDSPQEQWALLPGLEQEARDLFARAAADGLSKAAVQEAVSGLVREHAARQAEEAARAQAAADAEAKAKLEAERKALAEAARAKQEAEAKAEHKPQAEEEARQAEAEARRREEEARQAEQERQRAEAEARRAAEEAERKEAARVRQEAKAQRRAAREADRGGRKEPPPAEPPCRAENLLAQSRHATVKDAAEFAAGVVNGHPQPDDVLEELLSRLAASAQLSGRGKRACRAALVVLTRKDGPSPAELAAALAPAGNGPVAVPA